MKNFFVAACMLGALASCTKEDAVVVPASKKEMITSSNWKVSKVEAVVNGQTADATDTFLEDCNKDNFQKFAQDGKLIVDNGATKCDPNDKQVEEGTWAFSENDTKLTMAFGSDSDTYKVESLTESSFVTSTSTEFLGIQTTIKFYYVKK